MGIDFETIEERIKEIIPELPGVNDDGGIEIYCDYNDELPDCAIKETLFSDHPSDAFYDYLDEASCEYAAEYGWGHLENEIYSRLSDGEREYWDGNKEEINEILLENFYFYYPADHFNKNVHVNIMVDVGNMNSDFTKDDILNWYGIAYGYCDEGKIPKYSSMLWLARTQGKEIQLQKQVKSVYDHVSDEDAGNDYLNRPKDEDNFIESCIQEMENLPSHMATVTFLVSMKMLDLVALREAMNAERKLNKSYTPEQRKGEGYIVIGKEAMCGLYDPWSGGGSVLEVELDKDVRLPLKYIFSASLDGAKECGLYDVGDVYGMCGNAWKECLKETHYMAEEEISQIGID